MIYELVTQQGVHGLSAGPLRVEVAFLKDKPLHYTMSSEMAKVLATEAFWYKQFYLASNNIAQAINRHMPEGQIKRMHDALDTALARIRGFTEVPVIDIRRG